ncbi:SemiSWEET transporter [Ideonella sp. BN130291]|uniref:SemiSWEET transporter n=1 Tax=Ideonella sp. BN130291 TaxID=3112940 RepID=UPI002E25760A|nr:SemiSWEET transporter [Ideonella sp. BN130291]
MPLFAVQLTIADWLGTLAALLTTTAFVPQAWLTFRTRDVSGISLGMYACFTCGIALWLAYGVLLDAWPIIVANAVSLVLATSILVMKVSAGNKKAVAPAGGDGPGLRGQRQKL